MFIILYPSNNICQNLSTAVGMNIYSVIIINMNLCFIENHISCKRISKYINVLKTDSASSLSSLITQLNAEKHNMCNSMHCSAEIYFHLAYNLMQNTRT
jgi:hypothetical protein